MAARQRALSALGKFRRDFWRHVADRHADEVKSVKPDYAGSNVYHPVDEANLRISQYVARGRVGVYLVTSHRQAPDRRSRVEPYVEPLREALNDGTMDEFGDTELQVDTRDRANWDRMADWLHHRRVIYARVLHKTEASGSGYRLTPYDPDFARQMALADDVMRDDREVLRALAK